MALARALVVQPRILLLDEPLSALDARIRRSLRQQIRAIQQRLELTTIFVTHDQEEALTLSDRIFLMNKGSIVQSGTPEKIYTRPPASSWRALSATTTCWVASRPNPLFGPRFQRQAGAAAGVHHPAARRGGQPRAQPARHRSPAAAARQRHPLSGGVRGRAVDGGLPQPPCRRSAAGGQRRDPGGGPDQLCEVA